MGILKKLQHRKLTVMSDAKSSGKPSKYNKHMHAYYKFLTKGTYTSPLYEYVFDTLEDAVSRDLMEALLISVSKERWGDTEKIMGYTKGMMEIYSNLFLDVDKFRGVADRWSYIESHASGPGKELKVRAINFGPEFIFFQFASRVPSTQVQSQVLKRMFFGSAYRAMEANLNPIASVATKEAVVHAKAMFKAYELIMNLMDEDKIDAYDLPKIILAMDDDTHIKKLTADSKKEFV